MVCGHRSLWPIISMMPISFTSNVTTDRPIHERRTIAADFCESYKPRGQRQVRFLEWSWILQKMTNKRCFWRCPFVGVLKTAITCKKDPAELHGLSGWEQKSILKIPVQHHQHVQRSQEFNLSLIVAPDKLTCPNHPKQTHHPMKYVVSTHNTVWAFK